MIKPKALQKGDRVAVLAPASSCDLQDLKKGVAALESMGFEVVSPERFDPYLGYLAAPDEERLGQLHAAFADKSIRGIFCARGGYGSMRLVARLKPEVVSQDPKVFVGYSDITTLLNVFSNKHSMVTFHGPLVAKELDVEKRPLTLAWLERAVMTAKPLGEITSDAIPGARFECLSGGQARGILVGGNLTLVAATLGTDFEIQTDGKILLLEDRGERPYRIDRLLHHLKLAKKFSRVAGILLGEFADCGEPGNTQNPRDQVLQVLRDVLADVKVPILFGFPAGHGAEQITLPLGVTVALEAERGSVKVLESAVV